MNQVAEKVFELLYARGVGGLVKADREFCDALDRLAEARGLTRQQILMEQDLVDAVYAVAAADIYNNDLTAEEKHLIGFPVPTTGQAPQWTRPIDGWAAWFIGVDTDFPGYAGLYQKWGPDEVVFVRPDGWPPEAASLVVGLRNAPYNDTVFAAAQAVAHGLNPWKE